jgi:hypothetical protein
MAKVYQRVIVGRVEMDHPNHSTSHDPEIIMHTQLLWMKNCQRCITSFYRRFLFMVHVTMLSVAQAYIVLKMRA